MKRQQLYVWIGGKYADIYSTIEVCVGGWGEYWGIGEYSLLPRNQIASEKWRVELKTKFRLDVGLYRALHQQYCASGRSGRHDC